MPYLTRQQFAKRAGVSHVAIGKALRIGKLVARADGRLNTEAKANAAYLASEHVYSSAAKAGRARKGSGPKGRKGKRSLYDQKLEAEIREKTSRADNYDQARARSLGLLIERETMDRMLAAFGVELKVRLLDMPRRLAQRITAIAKEGPRVVEALLDQEITDALKRSKEKARAAGLSSIG